MTQPKIKWMTTGEIRSIAESVRNEYWPEGGLINIDLMVDRIGLNWDYFSVSNSQLAAYLSIDRKLIAVNRYYEDWRDTNPGINNKYRYAVAHELGHYFLHEYAYTSNGFSDYQSYSDFISSFDEKTYKQFEWQANMFAGYLLVPTATLTQRAFHIMHTDKTVIDDYAIDRGMGLFSLTERLVEDFSVSNSVIDRRLREESLLF